MYSNSSLEEMKNKRKNQRKNCFVPIDGKSGSPFDQTTTVDISKGGIGFVSERKIPLNSKIAVEIDFSPEETPVLVIGKIKWVTPINGSKKYRVGMIFDDVLRGSKSRLQQQFRKIES